MAHAQLETGPSPSPGERGTPQDRANRADDAQESFFSGLLFQTPEQVDPVAFWSRAALLVAFAIWGFVLIGQDYRTGEIGSAFLHRPLLIFHEAGNVVFGLFGEWATVLGGYARATSHARYPDGSDIAQKPRPLWRFHWALVFRGVAAGRCALHVRRLAPAAHAFVRHNG